MEDVSYDWGSERPARSSTRPSTRTTPRLARLRQACATEVVRLAELEARF